MFIFDFFSYLEYVLERWRDGGMAVRRMKMAFLTIRAGLLVSFFADVHARIGDRATPAADPESSC